MVTRRAGILLLLVVVLGASSAHAERRAMLSGAALLDALTAGGLVIYFRHAQTDWSQYDQVREAGDWLSCDPDNIRQLSAEGRDTARRIGAAMRDLAIPVSAVLASPYCRTMETARLLGLGEPEPTTDVMNMRVASYFGGRDAIIATARRRFAEAPAPGTNTVIVAHGNVARDATPVYPDEAEAVMFRADGQGGFTVVGRLLPAQWEELASR